MAVTEARPLTLEQAQNITVDATPRGKNAFTGPDQLLKDLGVIGDAETNAHKDAIIQRLPAGVSLDKGAIKSGPAVSVAVCRNSVFTNAS